MKIFHWLSEGEKVACTWNIQRSSSGQSKMFIYRIECSNINSLKIYNQSSCVEEGQNRWRASLMKSSKKKSSTLVFDIRKSSMSEDSKKHDQWLELNNKDKQNRNIRARLNETNNKRMKSKRRKMLD